MKLLITRYVMPVVAIFALGACSSEEEPVQSTKAERNFIVEGNEAYAEGDYAEAEAAYRKALSENEASEMAQFNLASALLRQDPKMGKNAPAPMQPQQADTASQEEMSQQLQAAVEILKNLAENSIDPRIVSVAAYDLGNISYKQQDYGQAIECYKEALRKNPKYDEARYNLRMAQLKNKDNKNNQNQNNQNKDQNKDKDKDQDKDQNKDQNKDQDKQDQKDKQDKQDKQDQQNQQQQQQNQQQQQKGGMSQQNMEQILRTMQNQENATQQRVNAKRAKQQEGERVRTRNKW